MAVITSTEREQYFKKLEHEEQVAKQVCDRNIVKNLTEYIHKFLPSTYNPRGGQIPSYDRYDINGCEYNYNVSIDIVDDEAQKYGYGVYVDNEHLRVALDQPELKIANDQRQKRNIGFCSQLFQSKFPTKLQDGMEISKIQLSKKCSIDSFIDVISKKFPSHTFGYKTTSNPETFDVVSIKK